MTTTTVGHNPDQARQDARRGERYRARHVVWDLAPQGRTDHLKAVRKCGRVRRTDGGVKVMVSQSPDGTRVGGFSGLSSCGSVWACPVCSAKIAARRQQDIAKALAAWHVLGGRVAILTLTMRHNRGQRLKTLWDGLSSAWNAVGSGRAWKSDQVSYGQPFERTVKTGKRAGQVVSEFRIPSIRVVEVTHGPSGWHVHVHALLFLPPQTSQEQCEALGKRMFERWSRDLVASGFAAPEGKRIWDPIRREWVIPGWDCRRLNGDPAAALGEYFTKAVYSASMESARGDLKDAKGGNRTPFGILHALVIARTGELSRDEVPVITDDDEALWAEWEEWSKGRRQVAWSPGLRAMLLPDEPVELTDEEIAAEEAGGDAVAEIEPGTWRQIARRRADWLILAAFVRGNRQGWEALAPFVEWADQEERAQAADRARWKTRT